MITNPAKKAPIISLEKKHEHRTKGGRQDETVLLASAYGSLSGHGHNIIGAFVVGSDMPGGRFVINTPEYIQATSRVDRTVMLPDITGLLMKYNDGATDYSDVMVNALDKDGLFRFIGVSGYGGRSCKDDCVKAPCCPIGYEDDANRQNFTPMRQPLDVITSEMIHVPTELDTTPNDDLHVRVRVVDKDADPCQYIGGVTPVADAGTQPLGSNVRIDLGGIAGSSILLHLGGMSLV